MDFFWWFWFLSECHESLKKKTKTLLKWNCCDSCDWPDCWFGFAFFNLPIKCTKKCQGINMQSIFKGSKTCLATLSASARCKSQKVLWWFSSMICGKGKKAAGTLTALVFVICHSSWRLASKCLKGKIKFSGWRKKVKIEAKEEIQRQKKWVIVLADMDDCTSGSILPKAAGIKRSMCLGLKINKEKKTKTNTNSLFCSHVCECTN